MEDMQDLTSAAMTRRFDICCIPNRYRGAVLDERYRHYVDGFSDNIPYCGYYFWGGVGTGKTYTACAIACELIRMNLFPRYTTALGLYDKLRDTFHNGTTENVIDLMTSCPLLIIDDIGKAANTAYTYQKLFQIVDIRYSNRMPLIVTCNRKPSALVECMSDVVDKREVEALIDRLSSMCGRVQMEGASLRVKL